MNRSRPLNVTDDAQKRLWLYPDFHACVQMVWFQRHTLVACSHSDYGTDLPCKDDSCLCFTGSCMDLHFDVCSNI